MGQWAIMVTYHGTEPHREALRAAINAMMANGVNMEPQTVTPIVLNENEIAAALIAHATPKDNIKISTSSNFDNLCNGVCIEIAKDPRIESVVNKYVLSRICCIDNAFSRNINSIVETNLKLQFVKHIKDECNLGLKEAKDLADALYDVVQKCQGRIVE